MARQAQVVWVALWHLLDTGIWDDEGRNTEEVKLVGVRATRKQAQKMCQRREQPRDIPEEYREDYWEYLDWHDNQAFIERCAQRGFYSLHKCRL